MFFILACTPQHIATPPTTPVDNDQEVLSPAALLVSDPVGFVFWSQSRQASPLVIQTLSDNQRTELQVVCVDRYTDPPDMTPEICAVVAACEMEARSSKLACSCLRCLNLYLGRADLIGCEREAKRADLSGACD